jgi:hypothetical protein
MDPNMVPQLLLAVTVGVPEVVVTVPPEFVMPPLETVVSPFTRIVPPIACIPYKALPFVPKVTTLPEFATK